MKIISTFLLTFCLFTTSLYAQHATISGKVTDENGEALVGANVYIKDMPIGASADVQGNFHIENVPAGQHMLMASSVGYEPQGQVITVAAGEQLTVNFNFNAGSIELQAVEIIGRKETTYKNDISFVATKTATPIHDVPQSISYVPKEVMQDQQVFRTGEVVRNISGVNQFSGYDDFTLRGFRMGDNQLINGLRVAGSFWTQPMTINLERIEVIKGPASALFGNADPGGTINRVTKKPLDVARQSLSFTTGSFNTYRATADFTGPMNEDKTLLYRLNLGYQNTEGFRNLQGTTDVMIAPSISFLPTDKTRVNFDMVYSTTRGTLDRGQPIFGASAGTDLNSTPISFAIGKANDYMNEDNLYITASLSHEFTENFSFNASYMKYAYKENLMEHRTSNNFAVDSAGNEFPTLMEMQVIRRISKSYNDNLTTYLVYDANTGVLRHKLLLGYDFAQKIVPIGGSSLNARGYRNASNTGAINTYNPANKDNYLLDANGNPVPNVPHFDLTSPSYVIADISDYFTTSSPIAPSRYYVHGVYLQDQIEWGRLQVLLGLRQEFYTDLMNYQNDDEEEVKQDALIPRIGLVYEINSHINAYGTYVQGYQPQGASVIGSPDIYGGPFDPLTSKMFEFGTKTQWFDGQFTANLAFYQIEQNNILINADNPGNPEELQQRGQERARGVELDVVGNILPNLSVIANYAYNHAEITESDNEEEVGRLKENAPLHQGGIWARYTFENGALQGLGVGLGSNFVTKRNTFDTYALDDQGNELGLQLPAYTVFDAALFYRVDKFQIALKLNNLTDKTHWVGGYSYTRLYPGAPRNFLATVAYTF